MSALLLALVRPALAAATLGGAWSPAGAGTIAWDDAQAWSGTLAGEFDGLLRPPLTAWGGWTGPKDSVTGGLALVRLGTATWADTSGYQGLGSTRFSLDYRRWLHAREAGNVGFYALGGGYYILPNAKDVNDGYTPEEQDAADEGAASARARIGGMGAQLGVGAEYVLGDVRGRPAVALGIRYLGRVYRGQSVSDTGSTVSTVLLTEAALTVELIR